MLSRLLGPLIVVVLVGACTSSDEEPSRLPAVTTTATAPDVAATAPSPGSTAAIEAEITEFFEDYIDTVNESWTSAAALRKRRTMFTDACSDCLAGYRFARRAHDDHLTVTGDDLALLDLKVTSVDGELVTARASESSPPGELVSSDGTVIQEFDAYPNLKVRYQVRQREGGGKWRIVRSEPLQRSQ